MMAKNSESTRTSSAHFDPLSHRIGELKRERAELEEEVLQLRAAVQIWTAVRRQIMATAASQEVLDTEMR
jgi:hypothetical protein